MPQRSWFSRAVLAAVIIAALNALASICLFQGLHWHLRDLPFPAQNLFKPLLLLNGVFIAYLAVAKYTRDPLFVGAGYWILRLKAWVYWTLLAVVVVALYLPSLGVNFADHDWTHRHIAASLDSAAAIGKLFVTPQPDGMYRPLAFLSFLLDYLFFKDALWAYHLQSIGLHAINVLLMGRLAIRLGFPSSAARTSAALFGVSAVHFEAILWPAARFDPLAAMLSLLCIIFFLDCWTTPDRPVLFAALSLICFNVGVLNKETAYSVVLLIPAIVLTRRMWQLDQAPLGRARTYIAALFACAAGWVMLRLKLFHGIGGYAYSAGHPASADISIKSVILLVERSLALTPFGVNCAVPALGGAALVGAYAILIAVFGLSYAGSTGNRIPALVGFTLASAVPAITVMGWIQPSLQHSRHLYWPSVWLSFAVALAIQRTSRPAMITCALLVIQAGGLLYNISIYRSAVAAIDTSVAEISGHLKTAGSISPEVRVIGVPNTMNGVLYFSSELQYRLKAALPNASLHFCDAPATCGPEPSTGSIAYTWDAQTTKLHLR